MMECSEFPHAYDNLGSVNSPARSSFRLGSQYVTGHRRTSSNVSSASASSQSNVNPSFRLDDEIEFNTQHYTPTPPSNFFRSTVPSSNPTVTPIPHHVGSYGSAGIHNTSGEYSYISPYRHTRSNSQDSHYHNSIDRPSNLEVMNRLRSSLKRSNYTYNSPNKAGSKNNSNSGKL